MLIHMSEQVYMHSELLEHCYVQQRCSTDVVRRKRPNLCGVHLDQDFKMFRNISSFMVLNRFLCFVVI